MHAANRILKTLCSLGLTDYQAKAYLALLGPGTATAEEVSRASGVPRSKVYLVLEELGKKEWVEVERGRPLRFRPRDPGRVIDERLRHLEEEAGLLKTELAGRVGARDSPGGADVEFISGLPAIIDRELDLISDARHIIVLTGALYLPEELEALVPHLYRAAERGVTVVVVSRARVTVGGRDLDIREALSEVPGRKRFEETSSGIKKIMADGARGMVLYAEVKDNGVDEGTLQAFTTRNRGFLEGFNPRSL